MNDQVEHPAQETPPPAAVVGSVDAPHADVPPPDASAPGEQPAETYAEAAEQHAAAEQANADSQVDEARAAEVRAAQARAAEAAKNEAEDAVPLEEIKPSDEPPQLRWYILKVQSNREDTIREALQRRIAMAGLERFFDEIIVPIEMVSEFKGGKKRIVKRKLYPGYLVAHMEINDDTWFLVRETPGIGDFTGSAGKPAPMQPSEVARILAKQEEKSADAPKVSFDFAKGDRVKIKEGTFENFEGEVDGIDEGSGRVTVMINIFGRSTPVELEHWQIETL